jgi:UDP-glucose 4-epimerase
MKYIVVTGGAGFIGSNLISSLLNRGHKNIISLDNYSTGNTKNHIKNFNVKYINSDTSKFSKVFKKYEKKIKVVFHFAEFSRIAQSFKNCSDCFNSNIKGSYEVIKFCLDNNIKIIYSATSASLGNLGQDQNLSPYAHSKSHNMNLIMNMHDWFGLKYEIIYFYNVYGPNQISNSSMAAVIGIFEYCYKNNKPLPVVKPGTQTRRFTHVQDTVDACIYAWKKNLNRHYSISNKTAYSIIKLANLFKKKIKLVPERRGERFESKIVKKIRNLNIINLEGKKTLKKYVEEFKKI